MSRKPRDANRSGNGRASILERRKSATADRRPLLRRGVAETSLAPAGRSGAPSLDLGSQTNSTRATCRWRWWWRVRWTRRRFYSPTRYLYCQTFCQWEELHTATAGKNGSSNEVVSRKGAKAQRRASRFLCAFAGECLTNYGLSIFMRTLLLARP